MADCNLPSQADFLANNIVDVDLECIICHEPFSTTHSPVHFTGPNTCRHYFGRRCIEAWLKSNNANCNTCPICRTVLFQATFEPRIGIRELTETPEEMHARLRAGMDQARIQRLESERRLAEAGGLARIQQIQRGLNDLEIGRAEMEGAENEPLRPNPFPNLPTRQFPPGFPGDDLRRLPILHTAGRLRYPYTPPAIAGSPIPTTWVRTAPRQPARTPSRRPRTIPTDQQLTEFINKLYHRITTTSWNEGYSFLHDYKLERLIQETIPLSFFENLISLRPYPSEKIVVVASDMRRYAQVEGRGGQGPERGAVQGWVGRVRVAFEELGEVLDV